MTGRATSAYQTCHELFGSHPLAIRDVNPSGTVRSMVVMVQDGQRPRFFVLSQGCGCDAPVYSFCPWPAGDVVDVRADDAIPESLASAVARGIPLPRHGSMFGWTGEDAVDALVMICTDPAPGRPLPCWSVMPLAGIPEARWPPVSGRPLFGPWFWEHCRAGRIMFLDDLIAEAPGAVFWVNTRWSLGFDCCAVAREISGAPGHTLRRGRYVGSEALRSGRPVPSLTALLADSGKIDMAGRFRRPVLRGGWPGAGR